MLATADAAHGGNAARAVSLAQRACELTGNQVAANLDTLAVAYFAAGRAEEAARTEQSAWQLAKSAGQTDLAKEIEVRLEIYRRAAGAKRASAPPMAQ